MRIRTSKEIEYTVDWIDTVSVGGVFMQMPDDRALSVIAEEFEGVEWIERYDTNQGDKRFDGYTRLDMIQRAAPGVVLLKLMRGG